MGYSPYYDWPCKIEFKSVLHIWFFGKMCERCNLFKELCNAFRKQAVYFYTVVILTYSCSCRTQELKIKMEEC